MASVTSSSILQKNKATNQPAKSRRSWKRKFYEAARGVKWGIRGQSSFFVHFFVAALVIAGAIILRCNIIEWCFLIGCIGFVLVAELFNSAVETLFRGLDEEAKTKAWPALDISAGAVLLASITAGVIGLVIFLFRLWRVMTPPV